MVSSSQEFYRIKKLPTYVFAVIDELKAKAEHEIIDLGMGNPDAPTPKPVVKKLIEEARHARNHRYSMSRGIQELRSAMADRYARNYGVSLDTDKEMIVTMGAKEALAHLAFAVLGPGDTVVVPSPCYPIHQYGAILAEGNAHMLPMPDPASFLNSLEDLYKTSARPPEMVLVSFPHNPTGQTVDLDFFRELVRMAAHHGTMLVHDFAYADICFDGYKAPSLLQVDGAKEVGVEICSMSKSYNMAGWRVGFCMGNAKMVAALTRIKSYLDYGMFQPIQIAAATGLRDCEADTHKICAMYQKRRDVLLKGLKKAGWTVEPPRGSMFVWAPLPEPYRDMSSLDFAKLMITEAHVAVSPGIGFGPLGEGFVRFALVQEPAKIRQATTAIGDMIKAGRKAPVALASLP